MKNEQKLINLLKEDIRENLEKCDDMYFLFNIRNGLNDIENRKSHGTTQLKTTESVVEQEEPEEDEELTAQEKAIEEAIDKAESKEEEPEEELDRPELVAALKDVVKKKISSKEITAQDYAAFCEKVAGEKNPNKMTNKKLVEIYNHYK